MEKKDTRAKSLTFTFVDNGKVTTPNLPRGGLFALCDIDPDVFSLDELPATYGVARQTYTGHGRVSHGCWVIDVLWVVERLRLFGCRGGGWDTLKQYLKKLKSMDRA